MILHVPVSVCAQKLIYRTFTNTLVNYNFLLINDESGNNDKSGNKDAWCFINGLFAVMCDLRHIIQGHARPFFDAVDP